MERRGRPRSSRRGPTMRRGRPGGRCPRANNINERRNAGMEQVTREPEPRAQAQPSGGGGTAAPLQEVAAGRRAPDERTSPLAHAEAGQDELESLYRQSLQDLDEGEVVRGRIVTVKDTEVLVDVGYKSEGTIPLEEFQRTGIVPK